ncbi:hypothetical protein BGZ79_004164 [Entomortierella chlamydospora]|nr:hypothetical protein BGZ79_004164 [Entomortierella chlamydospora]
MYKINPQALAVARRSRSPTLLVASTIAAVTAGTFATKVTHCQYETDIQAQAEDLKDHIQEFTENVLEMTDTPYGDSNNNSYHFSGDRRRNRIKAGGPQDSYAEEPLVPALLYITVAGMAGSIIARRSNLFYRFLSPAALIVGTSAYCIPRTTNNVIHGFRTLDYKELGHEWGNRFSSVKESLVGAADGVTAAASYVVYGTKDAVEDITNKTQELSEKTQDVLSDAKDMTVEVASDLKGKGGAVGNDLMNMGQDIAKEVMSKGQDTAEKVKNKDQDITSDVRSKTKDLGNRLEDAKDQAKDQLEEKADQAKSWWNYSKSQAEKSAKDLKRSARETAEQARDRAQNISEDDRRWAYENVHNLPPRDHAFDKDDIKRGFDRFKSKARRGWESARDEAQEAWKMARDEAQETWDHASHDIPEEVKQRGRGMRRKAQQYKDEAQDWARSRSGEMRNRLEDMKEIGEDWAQDRRQEAQKFGREAEGYLNETLNDFKKYGQGARDSAEEHFNEAKDDLRRRLRMFEDEFGNARSRSRSNDRSRWGSGSRPDEREEYAGRGYDRRYSSDDMPQRRSVAETAKEGKSWWRHKNAADPYEFYDNIDNSKNNKEPWWKAGSPLKDQAMDEFKEAKNHAKRGMGHFKDSVEDVAQDGRSWAEDKAYNLKGRFEYGKHRVEDELRDKFSRGDNDRGEEGRDIGDFYGGNRNRSSVYSNDNWFHYDRGENKTMGDRGHERGM